MSSKRYMSAKEAASTLDISLSTLYAYVSRGLIRSEASAEGKRQRRYYAEDIERLLARKESRRSPEIIARDALHWGAPIMDSAITLITSENLYYRGYDIHTLAAKYRVEDVAALIWTGDLANAGLLFGKHTITAAQKYETVLLQMEVAGAELTPVQELLSVLPTVAADDPGAYDLRPATVARTGARILRLMTSITAGDVTDGTSLAGVLCHGWCPDKSDAQSIFDAILILLADHELNASSFTARVVASAGATPYAVVVAGLSALQGVKHGGYTERVAAMLREANYEADRIPDVIGARLRRGESIPGFGHQLYTRGDVRARILLDLLNTHFSDHPAMELARATIDAADDLLSERPNIDFALVIAQRALGLPAGSALALFALGRTIGWIGHAIEEYEQDRLIRPRARYIGEQPRKSDSE